MRILPGAHLAVEVGWHDTGWDGRICQSPSDNTHCMAIPAIRKFRDDQAEGIFAGSSFTAHLPPCAGGAFLSSHPVPLLFRHPLAHSGSYTHLRPTTLSLPPYSVAAAPRWLNRREAIADGEGIFTRYGLKFRPTDEPPNSLRIELRFHQEQLVDSFFSAVHPLESLLFLYTRRSPLSVDSRPVLVAVGRVLVVGPPADYESSEPQEWACLLPARAIEHSIRPDQSDGFVFPYQRLLTIASLDPELPLDAMTCFIPEEIQRDFSGEAHLVDHDGARAILEAAQSAWRQVVYSLEGAGHAPSGWLEREIERVADLRSDAPGASAALRALGLRTAPAILAELAASPGPLWPKIEAVLQQPDLLSPATAPLLSPAFARLWELLPEPRRQLLELLSRFPLTETQADRLYNRRTEPEDTTLLEDPYLLASVDADNPDPVQLRVIDRGLDSPFDARRIRALAAVVLQEAAKKGHTLLPADELVAQMEGIPMEPPCPVSTELLLSLDLTAGPFGIRTVAMKDGSTAFQLESLAQVGEAIKKALQSRAQRRNRPLSTAPQRPTLTLLDSRAGIDEDLQEARPANLPMEAPPLREISRAHTWEDRLEEVLQSRAECDPLLDARALEEKRSALVELFEARLSVLVAPPQTGGTTLLKVLLGALKQVTVLAPTEVLLAEARRELPITDGYTFDTLPPRRDSWKNVVILHAGRLGEAELVRLLKASWTANRILLVGDPALPMPDTAGKPFVDLVNQLAPHPGVWPRVAPGYAELTVRCSRSPILSVADWFSGRILPGSAAESRDVPERFGVRFVRWANSEELGKKLIAAVIGGLELKDATDESAFRRSVASRSRRWQLLSPVRGGPGGADDLNRRVQVLFRRTTRQEALEGNGRRFLPPAGWEQVIIGDRVVVTKGGRRLDTSRPTAAPISQGELGIVTGQLRESHTDPAPWKLEVSFPTREDVRYGFRPDEFPDDSDGPVALAYALSVRWGQGIKNALVYLVLPEKASLLTREMIYTALSSGREKVYIFHPGFADDLFRAEFPRTTDATRRYTNLFAAPEREDPFTPGLPGDEKAISQALLARCIDFLFQAPLEGVDGSQRFPTFRFEDPLGRMVYWEHLGPMRSAADLDVQEKIREWYREQGILGLDEAPWGGEQGILMLSDEGGDWEAALNALLDAPEEP